MRTKKMAAFPVAVLVALIFAACDRSPSAPAKPPSPPESARPHVAKAPTTHRAAAKPQTPVPAAQVESKVLEIMAEQYGVRQSELKRNLDLRKDLKADDLDQVELTLELEDTFGLTISDDAALAWRTVGDVVDFVRGQYKP
jgi:acyl carrier protein